MDGIVYLTLEQAKAIHAKTRSLLRLIKEIVLFP